MTTLSTWLLSRKLLQISFSASAYCEKHVYTNRPGQYLLWCNKYFECLAGKIFVGDNIWRLQNFGSESPQNLNLHGEGWFFFAPGNIYAWNTLAERQDHWFRSCKDKFSQPSLSRNRKSDLLDSKRSSAQYLFFFSRKSLRRESSLSTYFENNFICGFTKLMQKCFTVVVNLVNLLDQLTPVIF